MAYAVLISEEHPDIPMSELQAALRADGVDYEIASDGELVLIDGDGIETVADRLAMTFEISEVLYRFRPENYQKLATQDITASAPFAVRKVAVDDTEAPGELEDNIGRIIDRNSDVEVELASPEEVFLIYLYRGEAYLSRLCAEVDRGAFEARQNQYRPFSAPVTLHPRMARAMVNLSEVERGGTVLDPFCGTGGILLEAGLIGCEVYGSDADEHMVEGARENLEAFGVEGDIRHGEVSKIEEVFDRRFDAVVTDLPYGKSSSVEGDPVQDFLDVAPDLAEGNVVFMSDRADVGGLSPAFEIFVHRSMSRYLYVLD